MTPQHLLGQADAKAVSQAAFACLSGLQKAGAAEQILGPLITAHIIAKRMGLSWSDIIPYAENLLYAEDNRPQFGAIQDFAREELKK